MERDSTFKALKISIASPEQIGPREKGGWSYGEVIKPETINYRTQRPEKDGLFSERIFGPTKDWECYCGKYRKIRYKGVVCDKCGVEVTRASVRRERMGHIKLATPVVHTWFLRSLPSRIGMALNESLSKLERVTYYAAYIVTSVDEEKRKTALTEIDKEFKSRSRVEDDNWEELKEGAMTAKESLKALRPGKVLEEREFLNLGKRFGNVFTVGQGGEGIRQVLEGLDLSAEIKIMQKALVDTKEDIESKKMFRRLKFFKSMVSNNMRPEWMVMTVLPVMPPDLRPMVPLDGGRYASSDLNDLYRRVINRNNRLKKLLELSAPDVIIVNEKRMLQEAIDSLIDPGTRGGASKVGTKRALRSLSEMLKGKQGRFRQNLLGKRVDYSGRSVIVVGPELKLDECGLPKIMALELFKPFVISEIMKRGLAYNIRNSNRLIEQAPPEVWEILEEVIKDRKVILNRQPTLHRLGMQAFKPILIEDLAIRIPPFVCTAFNADFDGDQMAVHLPLSEEAQAEASDLMLSGRNLLKPASGEAIAYPTQDVVLGCYYLTKMNPEGEGAGKVLSSRTEAKIAYDNGYIAINAPIKVYGEVVKGEETTCGRIIFNEILPKDFGYFNETLNKKVLTKLIGNLINKYGQDMTKLVLDEIKTIGFHYASLSGISWAIADLTPPQDKAKIIGEAEDKVTLIDDQFDSGFLTENEKEARVISIWQEAMERIAKIVPTAIREDNPVYVTIDSGARGSWGQPVQMMGMKGLVINPKGDIISLPIKTSLKEGHTAFEYFISTHGSRKGMTDTALKTAEAGYLTRRLIAAAQDMVIKEEDCKAKAGIVIYRKDGAEFDHKLSDRLFSRVALEDIKVGRKIVVEAGEVIDEEAAKEIESSDLEEVIVRSPITCKTLHGVCSRCYGSDLGRNELVKIGEAVGIVAAQSIGEPGTQLVLRTRHAGGIVSKDITTGLPRVEELFEVRAPKGKAVLSEVEGVVEKISEKGLLKVISIKFESAKKKKSVDYSVIRSTEIFVAVGDKVQPGDRLSEGSVDLRELFEFKGKEETYRYLVAELQKIYLSEGVSINNKHIELIIRQMFSKIKVLNASSSDLIPGEVVDKSRFFEMNRALKEKGKDPIKGEELLLGVTKTTLSSEGWLFAASFQETARVLVKAASEGKVDYLRGLNENVIIGRLLPIGENLRNKDKVVTEAPEV
ncbi:MAG TPA: DNA-directed RNA polymerase subunit beta' [Candidatus Paceibacterota bacterium]|nr:DNA-directed RNA polymerase subunit beta' [Candidatus Paceibacterota bacterium]